MTTTGRILHLLLALVGLLAAASAAHAVAGGGAGLIWQTLTGTGAYLAATALTGRVFGAHPTDAALASITTLAATIAAVLNIAATLAAGAALLFTDTDPADTEASPAPADTTSPLTKTA
jgi:hypothetical protein